MNQALAATLLLLPLGSARAQWAGFGGSRRADHVVRQKPLDLEPVRFDPAADFVKRLKEQEKRRLAALKASYPVSDPITGHYDPNAMRDWQKRVQSEQVSSLLGAAGDAALDFCRAQGICQGRAAEAVAVVGGLLFNGLHWRVPWGPFTAGVDTPPGVRFQMRRVRFSVGLKQTF